MNPWIEQLWPYSRRARATAVEEPAPPAERQRHEWRVRSSNVRMASKDVGRLEVCSNCNAERMVCVGEDGRTRVILCGSDPDYCGER
jgi:hypothetical protein